MQTDGNLVLYKTSGGYVWSSGTNRSSNPPNRAVFQNDYNFVIYNNSGTFLWKTGIKQSADRLVVQDDGNLVMYQGGTAKWQRSR